MGSEFGFVGNPPNKWQRKIKRKKIKRKKIKREKIKREKIKREKIKRKKDKKKKEILHPAKGQDAVKVKGVPSRAVEHRRKSQSAAGDGIKFFEESRETFLQKSFFGRRRRPQGGLQAAGGDRKEACRPPEATVRK